jgi:hypothetical protein
MEMINGGGDQGTDQEAEEDNRTVPDLNRLYTRDGPEKKKSDKPKIQ